MSRAPLVAWDDLLTVEDSVEAVNDLFEAHGWGDGLPVVPPTVARVEAMVAAYPGAPDDAIASLPPRLAPATAWKLAANAVLAGCRPEYFPVIVAAIQAMSEPSFNLASIQATTGPVAPLLIVNGPIVARLGLNAGANVFGQGWRANATIGRAIRLALLHIGGGAPGVLDMATMGQPAKYSYCIAENEAANPWEPLHVERGFAPTASTVTVMGAEGPININDLASRTGIGILTTTAAVMSLIGCNTYFPVEPLLVLCPEHAAILHRDEFTKDDIRRFIYDNARVPLSKFSKDDVADRLAKRWPKKYAGVSDDTLVTIAERMEDITIVVAGGGGRHSVFVPMGGLTRSVTREIVT